MTQDGNFIGKQNNNNRQSIQVQMPDQKSMTGV